MTPLLQVRSLRVPLPAGAARRFALDDVSFDVRAGEILCVIGESGSGKSMAANAVMGLLPPALRPAGGQILFQGDDLLARPESALRRLRGKDIGMVFQEPLSALNPVMKIGAQVAETLLARGRPARAEVRRRVDELLDLVGLPARLRDAYPRQLSGGQRQRVVIAMALALEPPLLIADEPTTALDVTTQAQILDLMRGIQRRMGMGILFITHDFGVVAEIADRVVVMEQGKVVEQGDARQVLGAPRHPYTASLIAAVPTGRARGRELVSQEGRPVLQLEGLRKQFAVRRAPWLRRATVVALDDVSLSVRRGETLGIVGESGSGKSTLAKCLVRLLDSDGGAIRFDGTDIAALPQDALRPLRRDIQMIFQDPYASLNPRHTVGRIIGAGPVAHGVPRAEAAARARTLLDLVGLDAQAFDRYPDQFSGGQRQRIGIARALALAPRVLVADECVSALDVTAQAQVLRLLQDLQDRLRIALVFITHDLRVAAQICDNIAVMHQGRVVEYGPPARILGAPLHAYTRRLIASIPGAQWTASLHLPPKSPLSHTP